VELQRSPRHLAIIRGREGGKGKERVGNREQRKEREGRKGRGREGNGSEGMEGERVGEGEGGLDLDNCPEAPFPEFLLTADSLKHAFTIQHIISQTPNSKVQCHSCINQLHFRVDASKCHHG